MAVDQLKTASQTSERSPGNPAQASHDAVAGPAARVVSLQRMLGNRATTALLGALHSAPALLQRQLRGQPNVVSGVAKLSEQRGREILEQFSRNDRSSVQDLVGPVPTGALNAQEWGLIRENTDGEVHLIFGKGGGVVWDRLLEEGTPLAHSHPWRSEEKKLMDRIGSINAAELVQDRREEKAQEGTSSSAGEGKAQEGAPSTPGGATAQEGAPSTSGEGKAQEGTPSTSGEGRAQEGTPPSAEDIFATQRRVTAGKILLPTISDFVLPAKRGMDKHTVFTPYAVDDAGVVSRPPLGDTTGPRLVWELTDIVLDRSSPNASEHKVTGRLTAKRGTNQLWTRRVQAPAKDEVDVLKRTSYKVIGD